MKREEPEVLKKKKIDAENMSGPLQPPSKYQDPQDVDWKLKKNIR